MSLSKGFQVSEAPVLTKQYASTVIREKLFVAAFLQCLNQGQAAIEAGYSRASAVNNASNLMKRPHVKAAIEAGLKDRGMGPTEIIARLSAIARGNMGDFIEIDENGYPRTDLNKAKTLKKLGLLKKLKLHENGMIAEVELHDTMVALAHLGRVHALFTDKIQVNGTVEHTHTLVREKISAAMANPEALRQMIAAAESVARAQIPEKTGENDSYAPIDVSASEVPAAPVSGEASAV